jgi:hypothetical protein
MKGESNVDNRGELEAIKEVRAEVLVRAEVKAEEKAEE